MRTAVRSAAERRRSSSASERSASARRERRREGRRKPGLMAAGWAPALRGVDPLRLPVSSISKRREERRGGEDHAEEVVCGGPAARDAEDEGRGGVAPAPVTRSLSATSFTALDHDEVEPHLASPFLASGMRRRTGHRFSVSHPGRDRPDHRRPPQPADERDDRSSIWRRCPRRCGAGFVHKGGRPHIRHAPRHGSPESRRGASGTPST